MALNGAAPAGQLQYFGIADGKAPLLCGGHWQCLGSDTAMGLDIALDIALVSAIDIALGSAVLIGLGHALAARASDCRLAAFPGLS